MLLEMTGITKTFPGVQALQNVDFSIEAGEVVALLGENGAGKSTLMKILGGVYSQDFGVIRLDGKEVSIPGVQEATSLGVSFVHQELNLAGNLNIAENIFLAHEPRLAGPLALFDHKQAHARAARLISQIGLNVPTSTRVGSLTTGQQQLVEIARALSLSTRVLILDEPTSSLSEHETGLLFDVIARLKSQGIAVIYISHRLGEIGRIADRAVGLKDGMNSGALPKAEISHDSMVRLMIGKDLAHYYRSEYHARDGVVMEVKGLELAYKPGCVLDFSLKQGEVLGLFGLIGAGRSEMARALFGLERILGGFVEIAGKRAVLENPRQAIGMGMGLVPEDRKLAGLILEMTVKQNMTLVLLRQLAKYGFWDRKAETAYAQRLTDQLRVKTPSLDQAAKYLSGGNQQKVVLAKWLALNPRILILDEPTRGVDVGAKQEIYGLVTEISKTGVAVLMISSEIEEIMGMSDRTLVMHEGRITGGLKREEFSEAAIMNLATGKKMEAAHA